MEYSQAKKIRDTPLSHLISASPGGMFSSAKNAIGLKMKAKMTGIQEKFDPMNMAKKLFGRGGAAFVGRAFGRKESSIQHFIGKPKGYGSATSLPQLQAPTATQVESPTGDDGSTKILQDMLSFMRTNRAEDIKQRETEQSFAEERESEKERRHDEFVKVLQRFVGQPKATLQKSGEGKGLLDHIKDVISGLTAKFKEFIDSMSWVTKIGPTLLSVARFFLTSPIGIALLAGATIYELLNYAAKNTNNMKAMTPIEAKNVLENGSEKDIEAMGGREALTKIAEKGSETAKKVLESGDAEKIKQAGGKELLEKSIEQGNQTVTQQEKQVNTVPPRPDTTGGKNAARARNWDNKFGSDYNPDGTSKKTATKTVEPPKTEVKPEPKAEQKPASPVSTAPPSAPVAKLSAQNNDLNTSAIAGIQPAPAPIVTATSSSGVIPDRPVTATASQRDNTHILRRTMDSNRAPAH